MIILQSLQTIVCFVLLNACLCKNVSVVFLVVVNVLSFCSLLRICYLSAAFEFCVQILKLGIRNVALFNTKFVYQHFKNVRDVFQLAHAAPAIGQENCKIIPKIIFIDGLTYRGVCTAL